MTMTQFRKEIKERKASAMMAKWCIDLVDYYDDISRTIETLWKDGFITNYSIDMLKLANGFQINTCNYETCRITDACDLHCIKMDKATVKAFAEFILY